MSYSFNLSGSDDTLQIALVRDEIDDISSSDELGGGSEGVNYFVTDERILARLTSAGDELGASASLLEKRLSAAASILDTLATNQAYILKKQETLEQDTDGPAVAAAIRAHAKTLRERLAAARKDREASEGAVNRILATPRSHSVPVRTYF